MVTSLIGRSKSYMWWQKWHLYWKSLFMVTLGNKFIYRPPSPISEAEVAFIWALSNCSITGHSLPKHKFKHASIITQRQFTTFNLFLLPWAIRWMYKWLIDYIYYIHSGFSWKLNTSLNTYRSIPWHSEFLKPQCISNIILEINTPSTEQMCHAKWLPS